MNTPTQPLSDLHAAIMNLPCVVPYTAKGDCAAYKVGHRDARHAAAELAAALAAGAVAAPVVQPSEQGERETLDRACAALKITGYEDVGRAHALWTCAIQFERERAALAASPPQPTPDSGHSVVGASSEAPNDVAMLYGALHMAVGALGSVLDEPDRNMQQRPERATRVRTAYDAGREALHAARDSAAGAQKPNEKAAAPAPSVQAALPVVPSPDLREVFALLNACDALLSNEEHARSAGLHDYQKGSPTWHLWEDLSKASMAAARALTASPQPAAAPVPEAVKWAELQAVFADGAAALPASPVEPVGLNDTHGVQGRDKDRQDRVAQVISDFADLPWHKSQELARRIAGVQGPFVREDGNG
jgi:hypothetical protein